MNWITSSEAGSRPNVFFLIEGAPGSGKTTLALQFLLAGVKNSQQGFYVTFSESEDEIRAVAESHGWTLDGIHLQELSTVGDRLKNGEQYTIFQPADVELSETVQRVIDDVRRLKPERVVIDSLSEIRLVARDPLRYRRQILALKKMLSDCNCTVFFWKTIPSKTQTYCCKALRMAWCCWKKPNRSTAR
jgi:circadian clock protein KaiC